MDEKLLKNDKIDKACELLAYLVVNSDPTAEDWKLLPGTFKIQDRRVTIMVKIEGEK